MIKIRQKIHEVKLLKKKTLILLYIIFKNEGISQEEPNEFVKKNLNMIILIQMSSLPPNISSVNI